MKIVELCRFLFNRFLHILVLHFPLMYRIYTKRCHFWGGGIIFNDIEKAIQIFHDGKSFFLLKADILKAYFKHGTTANEYFLLGFEGKNDEYRNTFLSDMYKDKYSIKCSKGELNGIEVYHDLSDKFNLYCKYKQYFKRQAVKVAQTSDWESFKVFAEQYSRFIVKPLTGSLGKNTYIETISKTRTPIQVFDDLLVRGEWIVEELIRQRSEMGMWNPSSVNTVRIPSIRSKNGIEIIQPFFRAGRNGMVVDNGGSGGIFATIDPENGIVISNGMDEKGKIYEKHPDSNIKYIGFQIPEWDYLISFAKSLHEAMPEYHKYVAFDFAYSDNGWVLVEANWGQFLGQYASKIGVRKRFEELMFG